MSNKRINIIVFLCFLLSGVAGLIYEVLWAKYLSLIFGSTAYAYTLVLATFMAGLALGSFLFGWYADKVKDRLGLYAWIEIGIALFCIFTPRLFALLKDFYLYAARTFNLGPSGILLIKFIIGALIMLIPTALMGGTLPILSRYMIRSLRARGETVARLYYINSLGAVLGTIWAGFYLIYRLGFELSITTAASINFLAGGTVFVLRGLIRAGYIRLPKEAKEEEPPGEVYRNKKNAYPARVIYIAIAGIFLSGVVAMLYEVVWIRLLSLVLGSYTYSFSLMLAAFISGITIGSFLISRFMPGEGFTFLYFGLCEMLVGLSLILSIPLYEKLPYLFLGISKIFARTPETFALFETTKFLLCFLTMLTPTVFLGMTLPLVSKIASGKFEFLGRNIGSVFASNTLGNILGALLGGLILIPALGLKRTLEVGIIINLALGSAVLLIDRSFLRKYRFIFISCCLAAFIGYKAFIPEWNKSYFTAQLFRMQAMLAKDNLDSLKASGGREFLFYRDGLEATVAVTKSEDGFLRLYVNGKVDASSGLDMPTQILAVQIPLILKPDALDVLVIGLGSGVSCGSALRHPINNLDLVEISASVVQANKYFSKLNYNALADKRLHLYIEDAKTFIKRARRKYDLIVNEPSNPWMSGVGNLFSVEYFRDCLNSLKEGGLMAQWVQAYEIDDETYQIVLRTFHSVFPEVTVWNVGHSDTVIIGSRKKITPDFNESEKRISLKPVKDDLARIGLHDLFTLLSLQLSSKGSVQILAGLGGSVNSDYYPVLEYRAPFSLYTGSTAINSLLRLDERRFALGKTELLLAGYLKGHKIDGENLKNLFTYINKHIDIRKENLLNSIVQRWIKEYPRDEDALSGYALYNIESIEKGIQVLEKLVKENNKLEYLSQYARLQLARHSSLMSFLVPEIFNDTVGGLRMCISRSLDKKAYFYYLAGKLYFENRDYLDAIDCYAEAEKLIKSKEDARAQGLDYARFLKDLAAAYLAAGNLPKGFAYLNKAGAVSGSSGRRE